MADDALGLRLVPVEHDPFSVDLAGPLLRAVMSARDFSGPNIKPDPIPGGLPQLPVDAFGSVPPMDPISRDWAAGRQAWPGALVRGVTGLAQGAWAPVDYAGKVTSGQVSPVDENGRPTSEAIAQGFGAFGNLAGLGIKAPMGSAGVAGGGMQPRIGAPAFFGERMPGVKYQQPTEDFLWSEKIPSNEPHRSNFIAQKETDAARRMDEQFDYSNSPALMLMHPEFWQIAGDFAKLKGIPLSESASTLASQAFALKGSKDVLTSETAQEFINRAHSMMAKNKNLESWAGKLAQEMGTPQVQAPQLRLIPVDHDPFR